MVDPSWCAQFGDGRLIHVASLKFDGKLEEDVLYYTSLRTYREDADVIRRDTEGTLL
jgi:hypothetical protein